MALTFNPYPLGPWEQKQQREAPPDPQQTIFNPINQGLNSLVQLQQNRAAQQRQAMLDEYMKSKEMRDQAQFNSDYGTPIDPNAMVGMLTGNAARSRFMPAGMGQVGTGRSLIEESIDWLKNGRPLKDARPEYLNAMHRDERQKYLDQNSPENLASAELKMAQAEKARRDAMMPPESDESYTIAGTDSNGNIIQVGNKSGKTRLLPTPGGGVIYPKNPTDAQATAAGYGDRAVSAHKTIDQLFEKSVNPNSVGFAAQESKYTPNFLKSGDIQSLDQAKRNFLNAILRRESGAVISPSEFEEGAKQYFPQYGDTAETVKQKSANRAMQIQNLKRAAGPMFGGDSKTNRNTGLMWQGRPLKDTPANRAWLAQQGGTQ